MPGPNRRIRSRVQAAGAADCMLLYIHVPFCRKKCDYCAFFSLPLQEGKKGRSQVTGYLSSLLGELRFWGDRLCNSRGELRLESIFFGGGTPSLLPAKAVSGFLEQVRGIFTVPETAEITVEANPESALAEGWLFEARAAGVNRLSLGVQSFDDEQLTLLGRCHDSRTAEAAFHTARAAGFSNISLDFMWGLPGRDKRSQSQLEWLSQLRKAIELQPEHISAYGLTLEPGSPLESSYEAGTLTLPPEQVLSSMYLAGADFLESRGYMQYEISNFAKMGFACRHNLGYWEGEEYLGFGPGATSTLDGRRWTNSADIPAWQRDVGRKELGKNAEILDRPARLKELLMLRLRMNKGLSFKEWKQWSGRSFLKDHESLVALLQQNGLASTRQGRFRLTRTGMLVSDTILAHFFERLEKAG